jgi:hypothetical protein
MKRKYEDIAFDRIKNLVEDVDKSIRQLGDLQFRDILTEKFALSDERAFDLIEIFSEMIPGVSYDAIPKNWFFIKRRKSVVSPRKMRHTIRDERKEITETIKSLWNLPSQLQAELIENWPDEWQGHLRKEKIITSDEEVVYTAGQIANLILAERYETTPTTINSYAKRNEWTDAKDVKSRLA